MVKRGGDLGVGEYSWRGEEEGGGGGGPDFSVARVPHPELVPREAPMRGEVGCEPRAEVS
jgi:hypothetical protein